MVAPYRWFWRLVWDNGKLAATSEGVKDKATALSHAERVAEVIGAEVEVLQPCVI